MTPSFFIHRYRMRLRQQGNARAAGLDRDGFLIRTGEGFACVHPWPELGDPEVFTLLSWLDTNRPHPLLERALYCAAQDGAARRQDTSLFTGLTIPPSHATVTEDADFPALRDAGFRVVKLKASGAKEPASLHDRIARAAAAGLKVRLDFNGTGHPDLLLSLLPWAQHIDFIEDPVPYDPARWHDLKRRTGFRLAADRLTGSPDLSACDVRVLKPAFESCQPGPLEAVITSYMDHPLGQMFAAWEAAGYTGHQSEAGLLTHGLYEPDAFTEAVTAFGPVLHAPAGFGLGFGDLLEALPWKKLPSARTAVTVTPLPSPGPDSTAFWESRVPLLLTNPRAPLSQEPASLPDNCLVFATSGSTGSPSLVCLTRNALLAGAAAVNDWLGATPDDIWLRVLPVFHVGGMGIHARAFLSGSRVVCDDERWNPARFAAFAAQEKVTLTSLVPAQVHDLVSAGVSAPVSMRCVVVGGGALESSLLARARALGWPLLPSYGLTEAASQVATAHPGDDRPAPALELLPCWEARTTADGRLQLRGAPLCLGKLVPGEADWEFHPAAGADGWFTTADRAQIDGRALTISGRSDRVVKVLGELVDLDAVETVLTAAGLPPGRGIVVARPDTRAGTRPWLVTDLPEADASALLAAAGEHLPPFARPAGCLPWPHLPRSPLGKVLRAEVEARLTVPG